MANEEEIRTIFGVRVVTSEALPDNIILLLDPRIDTRIDAVDIKAIFRPETPNVLDVSGVIKTTTIWPD